MKHQSTNSMKVEKKNESIHANDSSLSACLIMQLSLRENLIGVASCFDYLYLPENS